MHFGQEPEVLVLAPGRINLIGEHIDYNDGFVLPAAINRYTCFALRRSGSADAKFVALDLSDELTLELNGPVSVSDKMWANYLLGVVEKFRQNGKDIQGFEAAFSGNIPSGSGMSSSASLEC